MAKMAFQHQAGTAMECLSVRINVIKSMKPEKLTKNSVGLDMTGRSFVDALITNIWLNGLDCHLIDNVLNDVSLLSHLFRSRLHSTRRWMWTRRAVKC